MDDRFLREAAALVAEARTGAAASGLTPDAAQEVDALWGRAASFVGQGAAVWRLTPTEERACLRILAAMWCDRAHWDLHTFATMRRICAGICAGPAP